MLPADSIIFKPLIGHMLMYLNMGIYKCIILVLLSVLVLGTTLVESKDDQSGFISIDCGTRENSSYTDPDTGIFYTSDSNFVDRGINHHMSHTYVSDGVPLQLDTLRSFPEGIRNCYTLRPAQGKGHRYLIRPSFMYGNYDGKHLGPTFDLYIGEAYWTTLNISDANVYYSPEIVHTPSSNYIHICLVKTGEHTPFISALELRLLNDSMYGLPDKSMIMYSRTNINNDTLAKRLYRYGDDVYDRIWTAWDITFISSVTSVYLPDKFVAETTTYTVDTTNATFTQPPPKVMASCEGPRNLSIGADMSLSWNRTNDADRERSFYLFMYFAELQELKANEFREFNIYVNGRIFYGPFAPTYLKAKEIFNEVPLQNRSVINVTLTATKRSTLPPIINAIEIYLPIQMSDNATEDSEVAAIRDLKRTYGLTKNWQADPCVPQAFLWEGLNCSYDGLNPARIISLDLSSSKLNGTISPSIFNLTTLQKLDLSNNNLTGQVPEFLAELPSLHILNLKGNFFVGPYPTKLLQKANDSKLLLSIDEPSTVNLSPPSNGAERTRASTIIASVSVALLIALSAHL